MDTVASNRALLTKTMVINMPQMAIEALSENWLFKELGDTHWEILCNGLHTKSFDLKNDTDNRLYATFVRIRINCTGNLKSFKENQKVQLDGNMIRYGNSMYFSEMDFVAPSGAIKAELMTTFSIRDKVDNTSLAKGEPNSTLNDIEPSKTFPTFGNEYRLVKKKVLKELSHGDLTFQIKDEYIFQLEYEFNPFYDINGVNLLYFAAYPIINDVCEAKYFNDQLPEQWEQNYYTAYKDVLYYANSNLQDTIIYQLVEAVKLNDKEYKISSILRRKSDNAIIARIFSIKRKL